MSVTSLLPATVQFRGHALTQMRIALSTPHCSSLVSTSMHTESQQGEMFI
jgi:hypothetical protein